MVYICRFLSGILAFLLVVPFWKAVETLGSGVYSEKVNPGSRLSLVLSLSPPFPRLS